MTTMTTGKGKYGTRESLTVALLDTAKVETLALKILALQYGTTPSALRKDGYRLDAPLVIGWVDTKRRTNGRDWEAFRSTSLAVVGTEGVGYDSDDRGRITVLLQAGFLGHSAEVDISAKHLWSLRSAETVDLADHIRVFGDRLEDNHYIWHRRFTAGIAEQELHAKAANVKA
jgi:hypothetical protein